MIIVRKFPIPLQQDKNLRRTQVQAFLNEVMQIMKSVSTVYIKHDAWRLLRMLVSISKSIYEWF